MHKIEVLATLEKLQSSHFSNLVDTLKSLKLFKPRTSNQYRAKITRELLDELVQEKLVKKSFKNAGYQYSLTLVGKRYIDEKLS